MQKHGGGSDPSKGDSVAVRTPQVGETGGNIAFCKDVILLLQLLQLQLVRAAGRVATRGGGQLP